MVPRGPLRADKPARPAPALPPVWRRRRGLRGVHGHLRRPAAPRRLVPVRGSRLRSGTICPQGLVSSCLPPLRDTACEEVHPTSILDPVPVMPVSPHLLLDTYLYTAFPVGVRSGGEMVDGPGIHEHAGSRLSTRHRGGTRAPTPPKIRV